MRTQTQILRDIWTIIDPASVTTEMWEQEPVQTGRFTPTKRLMIAAEHNVVGDAHTVVYSTVLWDNRWSRRFGPFQDTNAIHAWLAQQGVDLNAPISATMPWDKVS